MYQKVYSIWVDELSSKDLQKISSDFFRSVYDYMNNLNIQIEESDDLLIKSILSLEKSYLESILKNLINLRLKKLVKKMLFQRVKLPIENLSDREIEIIQNLRNIVDVLVFTEKPNVIFNRLQDTDTNSLVQPQLDIPSEHKHEELLTQKDLAKYALVRFLQPIGEVVGGDLKRYGPFKKGDVAVLPFLNAKILQQKQIVEIIKNKKN